jgi:hypothetical protein
VSARRIPSASIQTLSGAGFGESVVVTMMMMMLPSTVATVAMPPAPVAVIAFVMALFYSDWHSETKRRDCPWSKPCATRFSAIRKASTRLLNEPRLAVLLTSRRTAFY